MFSLSLPFRAPPGSGFVQSLFPPYILSGSSPTTPGPEPGFPRPGLEIEDVEPGKAPNQPLCPPLKLHSRLLLFISDLKKVLGRDGATVACI